MKNLILIFIIVWLLVACTSTPELGNTPSTRSIPPFPSHTALPTSTPDLNHLDPGSILYEQNFEDGNTNGLSLIRNEWNIFYDAAGSSTLCNTGENYNVLTFGENEWKNYAVELRVEVLEFQELPYLQLMVRYNQNTNVGYYGGLDILNSQAKLNLSDPSIGFGQITFPSKLNTWYTFRVEVAGQQLSFYINDELIGLGMSDFLTNGMVGFIVSPHLKVCIDDIRAWFLTEGGGISVIPTPTITPIPINSVPEIVTDKADTQDGGNSWGGHQTRIVRTIEGVFTAYIVAGTDRFDKIWRVARRQENGSWQVIAEGPAGKEPVNLLASPDGTLHVISWHNGNGTMYSGKPSGNQITMTMETIPGVSHDDYPYNSAGISRDGDICILSSVGGSNPGGLFQWACKLQPQGTWVSHTSQLDYRYCYTYVFPESDGQLALVSTLDVLWSVRGYSQPASGSDYVFDGIGYWRTNDLIRDPIKQVYFAEEIPTDQIQFAYYDAQEDAYLDTQGNMHILYYKQGPSTQGYQENRHVILSPEGKVINDVLLPSGIGQYARIFQDADGYFYLLGSSGLLFPAGKDGITVSEPKYINLMGYKVEVSGYGISVPRTGTTRSNVLDVVFPSDKGTKWIYFQIPLP